MKANWNHHLTHNQCYLQRNVLFFTCFLLNNKLIITCIPVRFNLIEIEFDLIHFIYYYIFNLVFWIEDSRLQQAQRNESGIKVVWEQTKSFEWVGGTTLMSKPSWRYPTYSQMIWSNAEMSICKLLRRVHFFDVVVTKFILDELFASDVTVFKWA